MMSTPGMNPEALFIAFEQAISQIVQLARSTDGLTFRYLIEARTRLSQALYLLRRFREVELNDNEKTRQFLLEGHSDQPARDDFALEHDTRNEVKKVYCEAFYYFAFQCKEALECVDRQGGNLRLRFNFDPKGVRNVRNRLIAHPWKKGGILTGTWAFGGAEGLVLEPTASGPKGRGRLDAGLYPNAQEFILALTRELTRVIDE